jgi:phosphatidylserine/phosphatidylglycerophosphate/cardiolipin synthase-like enzyme
MHYKFAIFDGKLLVTGSYNWTASAERFNQENALFLDEPDIIRRYQARFDQLFNGLMVRAPAYPRASED